MNIENTSGEDMGSGFSISLEILRKLSRALILFIIFAIAIPLFLGALYGVSTASILSLITSTAILQAAAPPVGLALGLEPMGIIAIMGCFAVGMVVAILEICQSLAISSQRVKKWIDGVGQKMETYPAIRKYGAVSCIAIAWIPGIGLYLNSFIIPPYNLEHSAISDYLPPFPTTT